MHRIRLHGPWEVSGPLTAEPRSEQWPLDWGALFGPTAGVARFARSFQAPTNLDADERVWLSFAGLGGEGQISLNSHVLQDVTAQSSSLAVDITERLQQRNRLEIELRFDPITALGRGGIYGEVALMIETSVDITGAEIGD